MQDFDDQRMNRKTLTKKDLYFIGTAFLKGLKN